MPKEPPVFVPPPGKKPKWLFVILGILAALFFLQAGIFGSDIGYIFEELIEEVLFPLSPIIIIGIILYAVFHKKKVDNAIDEKEYKELMGAAPHSPASSSSPHYSMSFLPQRHSILRTFWILLAVVLVVHLLGLGTSWRGYGSYGGSGGYAFSGAPMNSLYVPTAMHSLISLPVVILFGFIRYAGWLLLLVLLISLPFAPSSGAGDNRSTASGPPSPLPRSILAQIFLLMLIGMASMFAHPPFSDLLRVAGSIFSLTLTLAVIYGIARLFGFVAPGLDHFFEHFPFPLPEEYMVNIGRKKTPGKPFDWRRLSLDALRFAGIILILSALFALFFNIEWSLARKLIACFAGMAAFLATGEALRRQEHKSPASLCMLGAFALAQYGVTLGYLYLRDIPGLPPLLLDPHTWLFLKLLVTCAFIFVIIIFPSKLVDTLFTIITYSAPYSMLFNDIRIALPLGSVYLCFATVLFLILGLTRKQPLMWIISTIAANSYLMHFLFMDPALAQKQDMLFGSISFGIGSRPALFALCIGALLFLTHLGVTVVDGMTKREQETGRIVHLVSLEIMALITLHSLRPHLQFLEDYIGIAWIVISALTFIGYVLLHNSDRKGGLDDSMLHISMIFSAVGIFIQANGPWSAIAFLVYAIILLWYSFRAEHKTTKVYGFIVLGIAILKLYAEFADIFKSVPGTVIILCLGLVLVVLSYRFEMLKNAISPSAAGKKSK